MAQIETTLQIELEAAKHSWMDMIRTPGMRRRTLLAAAMGLFTQWSGNTLLSFYLGKILVMIGYTDTFTKTRINLGNTAWSFINGTAIALISPRFKRRTMFLTGAIGMLAVYVSWTIAMRYAELGLQTGVPNKTAGIVVIFFIFFYSPWYNIGNNALAYTYMVELFPYAERSRGIAIEQFFVRGAGFFTTYINPIGMDKAGWKYLIMYIVMICVEILTIYFFYPETQGRTLEELAFCKKYPAIIRYKLANIVTQCLRMRATMRRLSWPSRKISIILGMIFSRNLDLIFSMLRYRRRRNFSSIDGPKRRTVIKDLVQNNMTYYDNLSIPYLVTSGFSRGRLSV